MTLLMNRVVLRKRNLKVFSMLGKQWQSLALAIRHYFICFAGVSYCFAELHSLACGCSHKDRVGRNFSACPSG